MKNTARVCSILFAFIAGLALQLPTVNAQQASRADKGFSFAVYGDSRSMMYLPYKQDEEPQARQLMVDMFALVLPAKVAPEVVAKDVKLIYDPSTKELVEMVMPFMTASEVTTLKFDKGWVTEASVEDVKLIYDPSTKELVEMVMPFMTASEVTTLKFDKGWVTEASVEDVKLLPGVSRTMFQLEGGDWVAKEVVANVKSGRAQFIVNTGDLVWWGKQGGKPSGNPYWKLVNEDVLKQLPKPDREMEQAGLPGRVYPAV
jgi:hypothetical protein